MSSKEYCEESEQTFILVYTPLVTFWGAVVANEVNRNLSNKFVGAMRQFGVAVIPCAQSQLRACIRNYDYHYD